MTSVNLQAKNNVKLVRRNLENLGAAVPKIAKFRIQEAATEIARRMSKPGKKIKYPVNWVNVKQRIKVIIMILKKQGSLPYVRTEQLERGWKTENRSAGVKVYNSRRGSKYVYGTMRNPERQSPIHEGRWPILRSVYDSVVKDLPKKVKESLKRIPKNAS